MNGHHLPPPIQNTKAQLVTKQPRNSNLELFRIIAMLLIIAHHYVVNSGLMDVIKENPGADASKFLALFGAWGKTGINCFVLITGYFMCKSSISLHKFLKLVTQIIFYNLVIFGVFVLAGVEPFSIKQLIGKLHLIRNMNNGFTSGFIIFYLFIPFLTILVNNLTRRQHLILALLIFATFTIGGSMPPAFKTTVDVNYVVHFSNLFIIASYVRLHGFPAAVSHRQWGWATILSLSVAAASVLFMLWRHATGATGFAIYTWVADSNKIFAMTTAFCSFMWFKDLKLSHSKTINLLGGATFGVLLIHANSDAMRRWLWQELVDCTGHFTDPRLWLYAPLCVIVIFIICAIIEIARSRYVENPILTPLEKWATRIPFKAKSPASTTNRLFKAED